MWHKVKQNEYSDRIRRLKIEAKIEEEIYLWARVYACICLSVCVCVCVCVIILYNKMRPPPFHFPFSACASNLVRKETCFGFLFGYKVFGLMFSLTSLKLRGMKRRKIKIAGWNICIKTALKGGKTAWRKVGVVGISIFCCWNFGNLKLKSDRYKKNRYSLYRKRSVISKYLCFLIIDISMS